MTLELWAPRLPCEINSVTLEPPDGPFRVMSALPLRIAADADGDLHLEYAPTKAGKDRVTVVFATTKEELIVSLEATARPR